MKHCYCCLFDRNYSVKALAMIRSLKSFDPSARVFILALDGYSEKLVHSLNEKYISLITLEEIEKHDVLKAKANRGLVEYYWTLSSVLTAYVFERYNGDFDTLTYLDSDILFFSNPSRIFSQMNAETSCVITPHNFARRLQDRIVNGKFCVQWVTFVNNQNGQKILFDWRADCLEWCYYRLENGKMGDQKYLDYWPERYNGVLIDTNIGAGVAPWNYEDLIFSEINGEVLVNGCPVIFYHFHQFTQTGPNNFDRLSKFYTDVCDVPETIYRKYEMECVMTYSEIEAVMKQAPYDFTYQKNALRILRRFAQTFLPHWFKQLLRHIVRY